MLVPNRHGSSNSYRYGFNGKEKDDELKGEGNSYDFGARMLDPRVGRWFAPDKMQKKYPDLSPFVITNNNPNLFVDFDGNDFGIIINHKTKQIMIVSTNYTINEKAYAQALKGAEQWNSKSATIDGYNVVFYMIVIPPPINDEYSKSTDRQKLIEMNKLVQNDRVGNLYAGNKGNNSKKLFTKESENESYSFVGGVTSGGRIISMNTETNYGDLGRYPDLVAHEMGHQFGLDDKDGDKDGIVDPYYGGEKGIMEYTGIDLYPISDNDVRMILNYARDYLSSKINDDGANVIILNQEGCSDGDNPIGVKNQQSDYLPPSEIID